jgi:hypothetical protein
MDRTIYRFDKGNFTEQTTGDYSGLFRTPYNFQVLSPASYAIYFPEMETYIVVTNTNEHGFVYDVKPALIAAAGCKTGDVKTEVMKIFEIHGIRFEEEEITDILMVNDIDFEICKNF